MPPSYYKWCPICKKEIPRKWWNKHKQMHHAKLKNIKLDDKK